MYWFKFWGPLQLGIGAIYVAIARFRESSVENEYYGAIARLHDAGQPVTADDLIDLDREHSLDLSSSQNIDDALAALYHDPNLDSQLLLENWLKFGIPEQWPSNVTPKVSVKAFETYIARNRGSLELLRRFSKLDSKACLTIKWGDRSTRLKTGICKKLKEAACLLALDCLNASSKNQADESGIAILALFGLAKSLAADRELLVFSTKLNTETLACQVTARVLPMASISPVMLQTIDSVLDSNCDSEAFERVIAGERLESLIEFKSLLAMSAKKDSFHLKDNSALFHDFLQYLKYMNDVQRCVSLQWPQSRQEAERISQDWGQICSEESYPLTYKSQLAIVPYIKLATTNLALKRLTRVLIAVELFRRMHNALPTSADMLVPHFLKRLPQDPFGLGTVCWLRDGQLIEAYSIGPNGKNNGGEDDDIKLKLIYQKGAVGM